MDKLREKLFYLYIFALGFPVFFLVRDGYKYPKRILSISILLFLFLLQKRSIKWNPITFLVFVYIFYAFVSVFWAKSMYVYLDWLYPYIYPLIVFYLFSEEFFRRDIEKFIWFLYVIGFFYGIYGIFQRFGIDPFLTFQRTGRFKVIGFFGNPIYFSDFILPLFIIFFTLSIGKCKGFKKYAYYSITLLLGIVIFFTFSRSAWLAIVVTLPIITYIRYKRKTALFLRYTGIISGVLLLILFLFKSFRDRFFSMFYIFNHSIWVRILIWFTSVLIIKEHPLFGVGAGNFSYIYTYYQGKFLTSQFGKSFVKYAGFAEKAHNEYIQIFVELGFLGFAIFIGLVFVYLFFAFRALKRIDRFWIYRLAFFGATIAFFIDGIPGFFMRVPSTSGIFWICLSFTFVGFKFDKQTFLPKLVDLIFRGIFIFFLIFYTIFMFNNFFSIVFEVHVEDLFPKKQIEEEKTYLKKAILCMPKRGKAHFLLGAIYVNEKKYKEGIKELKEALKSYNFCNVHYVLGNAYFFMKEFDKAEREYKEASLYCTDKFRSPSFWAHLWYKIALCDESLKKYSKAIKYYKIALKLDSGLIETYYHLGYVYYILGNRYETKRLFEYVISLIYSDGKITEREKAVLDRISKLGKITVKP